MTKIKLDDLVYIKSRDNRHFGTVGVVLDVWHGRIVEIVALNLAGSFREIVHSTPNQLEIETHPQWIEAATKYLTGVTRLEVSRRKPDHG